MKKIHIIFTLCLLISSNSRAVKKPLLRIETLSHTESLINGNTPSEQDPNTSARLSGCKEAFDNYMQQLEKLRKSPLGASERNLLSLIITDAQLMQETVTPISPEMGERFAMLTAAATILYAKN